ncbi:MAG: pyridoxamine 5'-phosphate oxidase family protein [Chitinophagaceae bacterium]|nr:MAG: pyridoxamine 5'-phosphate oxidase family protein [Chitinophagaceae bacterium]
MGKIYESITPEIGAWMGKQKIFFVATAPLSAEGHINCSPKGLDALRILDEHTVVYEDLTGSGVVTIAHIRENERILIMFCAFEGPPKIVRLHGKGFALTPGHPEFERCHALFPKRQGVRAYIRVDVSRVSDSCGYSVPLFTFRQERAVLDKWCANKGDAGIVAYRKQKNRYSIDGLPALSEAEME